MEHCEHCQNRNPVTGLGSGLCPQNGKRVEKLSPVCVNFKTTVMSGKTTKEELLQQQLYEGKITWLEFVQQSEHSEEFQQFCQDNGLPENEQTAQQFWDWMQEQEKQAHIESES